MNLNSNIEKNNKEITLSVIPEDLRIFGYLFFWMIILIGGFLTFNYTDLDLNDNPLIHMYGYNNICILFDSYPSTFILPILWVINFLILMSYTVLSWIRVYKLFITGSYPNLYYYVFSFSSLIEIIGICFFISIFTIDPYENMFLHTIPFTVLVFSLSLMGIKNYIFYKFIANITFFEHLCGLLYLCIHVTVSLAKITMQINGIYDDLLYTTLDYSILNQFVDRVWMITAAILPVFISIRFRKRVPTVQFKIN